MEFFGGEIFRIFLEINKRILIYKKLNLKYNQASWQTNTSCERLSFHYNEEFINKLI
jgi:hypothetical protein